MMVFLALYLEAKLHLPNPGKFLKVLLQVVFLSLGVYCGFTRISDYKHHWSDVLAGLSLGTIIAFIMVARVLKFRFRRSEGIEFNTVNSEIVRRNSDASNESNGHALKNC